jgi:hypothetical protein
MKPLQEAFGSRTFRRVVLPGIVITLGLHPALSGLLSEFGYVYGIREAAVILVIEIIFWGLLVSSAISPIYYVYEGFLLPALTRRARASNEAKLERLQREWKELSTAGSYSSLDASTQDRVSIVYEQLQDFPLRRDRSSGETSYVVDRPTRLGNIIATYELYPESRYDVDGVFYWHHLLAFAPASVVAEFSDQYAFAESLLLTSFAGVLVCVANAAIVGGLLIGFALPELAVISIGVGFAHAVPLCVFGLFVGWLFYSLSLPAHREAGKIFRAGVDLAIPQFIEWVTKVSATLPAQKPQIRALHVFLESLHLPSTRGEGKGNSASPVVRCLQLLGAFGIGLAAAARAKQNVRES